MKEQPQIKSIEDIKKENPLPRLVIKPKEKQDVKNALEAEKKEIAAQEANPKLKKKFVYNWPWKKSSLIKKTMKKQNEMIVFMLTMKKQLDILPVKIYPGNFFVYKMRAFRLTPSDIITMGKAKLAIYREYDRKAVSADDYEELLLRDYTSNNPGSRININDGVALKMFLNAYMGEKQSAVKSNVIWIVIAVVVGLLAAVWYFGGKK